MKNNHKTPLSVTIILISVLFITFWNMIRIYGVIVNWKILSEFGANPVYILTTGLSWSMAGSWSFVISRRKNHFALRANMILAGLYYLWYWIDRLFIQASPAPNTVFSAIFSTVLLIVFCIILNAPATRTYFTKEK